VRNEKGVMCGRYGWRTMMAVGGRENNNAEAGDVYVDACVRPDSYTLGLRPPNTR
jgi:hypothetical protein